MPKILILFAGEDTTLVDALSVGARAVRFSEVEVRQIRRGDESTSTMYAQLGSVEELPQYDAIILGVSLARGVLDAEFQRVLQELAPKAPRKALEHKVGAAFVTDATSGDRDVWPALAVMGDMGMLVVAPEDGGAEGAKALGGRVAQVAAMIAHVRSHHHSH